MSPHRILVVDDDPDIRLLVSEVLRFRGHLVEGVGGGLAAVAHVLAGTPTDLVVLDVQMPDVDGWDTLRALRASRLGADLPVVMCTVKAGPADVVLGWTLGCDGYLHKPFAIADLGDRVEAVLARTPEQRRAHRASELALAQASFPVGR